MKSTKYAFIYLLTKKKVNKIFHLHKCQANHNVRQKWKTHNNTHSPTQCQKISISTLKSTSKLCEKMM